MKKPIFSIIVPFYQNELNVPHTLPALFELGHLLNQYELEFVFVEDGSQDSTFDLLKTTCAARNDISVRLIKLSRNYGQVAAIRAGLYHATGQCAGIISADLQDPPKLFVEMIRHWEDGAKLVIAERGGRDEGLVQRLFSGAYWRMVRRFALPGYPVGGFDFCIVDRVLIDGINNLIERNTQIFPLIFSLGFPHKKVTYRREKRLHGKSQWSFAMKFKLFLDTFIAFSYLPIRCISAIGLMIAIASGLYAGTMAFFYFAYGNRFTGWTTIVVLIATIGGLTLTTLGIIGEYLWRILDQVRRRPIYLVERIHTSEDLSR